MSILKIPGTFLWHTGMIHTVAAAGILLVRINSSTPIASKHHIPLSLKGALRPKQTAKQGSLAVQQQLALQHAKAYTVPSTHPPPPRSASKARTHATWLFGQSSQKKNTFFTKKNSHFLLGGKKKENTRRKRREGLSTPPPLSRQKANKYL